MSDDSLTTAKAVDGFTTESPVRAFTDFQVNGNYAIGKGFRPSMAHLSRYLDAMETKCGWALVQIILPLDDATDPTIIFVKMNITLTLDHMDAWMRQNGFRLQADPDGAFRMYKTDDWVEIPFDRKLLEEAEITFGEVASDDPLNPKHYNGRECADIGELMTANSYQILKYNWRLGEKDSPCVELGKALWYLDSEIELYDPVRDKEDEYGVTVPIRLPDWSWVEARLAGKDNHVCQVAHLLYSWNTRGDIWTLKCLRNFIQAKLDSLNGCSDWGRGLEP